MTLTTKATTSVAITIILLCLAYLVSQAPFALGSTPAADSDYQATSTAASNIYGGWATSRVLKSGAGSFGSVVITGANTGTVNIYNATTTDVTKRTGGKATSSILIASFPASAAAGTYVFDASFTDGLYVDLVSGTMPTTTVTYR